MLKSLRKAISNAALYERLSFRLVWSISSAQLRLSADRALRSLPPSGPDAPLHCGVIIRPPAHVVRSVAPALKRLREISPHHHYYSLDSMHVTVGSVDRFLSDGSDAATRLAELRAIIGSYPSFDLTVRGLNISPSTVFAQVIPQSRTLRALRIDLRRLGRGAGEAISFGDYIRDLLPHMNIVRFSGCVTADFLEEVSGLRQEWFGRWTVREVDLMRTDPLHSHEGREVLERISLAPIHPSM